MNKKPFIFRISLNDKINFARNLALLLKSGISLPQALEILKESSRSSSLKYILENIIKGIERGQFLGNSLDRFSNKLDNFFISIIKVGEYTGKLTENLERIAIEFKKMEKLRNKIISALIYPSFIIVTMIFIMIAVIYFLFPKLLPIFENLNVKLPSTTIIFLKVSSFLLNYGIYLFLFIALLLASFPFLLRIKKIKYFFHLILLYIPFLSVVVRKYILNRFFRNLALLLESGIPIAESLKITSENVGNLVYEKIIYDASDFVVKGHSLGEFLNKNKKYFPYNFIQMISIGEKSGNLINTLLYLTENLDEEIDIDLERFMSSIEPIILITIAFMVGFIAYSIITPIYEISNKLQK
jgi:type IV pilus assembly protein PilC